MLCFGFSSLLELLLVDIKLPCIDLVGLDAVLEIFDLVFSSLYSFSVLVLIIVESLQGLRSLSEGSSCFLPSALRGRSFISQAIDDGLLLPEAG